MKNRNVTIIRWILSLLLMVGIYSETGIWTTLFAFLVCCYTEIMSKTLKTEKK